MYAIQKYVIRTMREKRLKRSEVVRRLGYTNVAKGCRRLDQLLQNLEYNDTLIKNLHVALDVPRHQVDEKLAETASELEEERRLEEAREEERERRVFVPYLFCQTERRIPSPIFVCAILNAVSMKYIYLPPDYNQRSASEQEEIRKALVAEKLQKNDGRIPSFGKITCFTLKRFYDDSKEEREVFDLEGNLMIHPPEGTRKITRGNATLTVKGKDISKFFNYMQRG